MTPNFIGKETDHLNPGRNAECASALESHQPGGSRGSVEASDQPLLSH